jgi:hypothetical protein
MRKDSVAVATLACFVGLSACTSILGDFSVSSPEPDGGDGGLRRLFFTERGFGS